MSLYPHNYVGEWVTWRNVKKIKQRRLYQNVEAIALMVQSFPCDLGSRSMIWKLESEIHKLSSTPKTEKKEKIYPSSHYFKVQKSWLIHLVKVPLRSGPKPWILSLCAFSCFVHKFLYTGLGSDSNVSLQQFLFGFHHNTKINKTISFWFSICHFGSMAVIFLTVHLHTLHINTVL